MEHKGAFIVSSIFIFFEKHAGVESVPYCATKYPGFSDVKHRD